MMYASHVRRRPNQQFLRCPLHQVGNNQGCWYADEGRVVADRKERNKNDGKRPEEYEARYEPPRILDAGYGELLRITVLVESSL